MKKYILFLTICLLTSAVYAEVIQKGKITIEGKNIKRRVVIQDLDLVVDYQERIDLGKYFTQEQILSSVDLHKAIEQNLIIVLSSGTFPDSISAYPTDTKETPVSVTATGNSLIIVLSTSTRKNALVQNASDVDFLYLGKYLIVAGSVTYVRDNGIRLDPGSYYETECKDKLYGVADVGKSVNVRIDIEY